MIAFNYVRKPDLNALVVKRKGRLIKGETEQLQAQAMKEYRSIKNAAKSIRKARRP